MAYPTISALPDTPNRQTDNSTEFSNKTDAFLNALESFREEVNAAGEYIDGTTETVNTLVTDAESYVDNVVSNATSSINSTASDAEDNINTTASNATSSINSTASDAEDNINTTASNATSSINSTASDAEDNINNAVSDAEDYIDNVASLANSLVNDSVETAASYAVSSASNADKASDSAVEAAASAVSAAASSNWVGNWEDAMGAGVKGTSYSYNSIFVYLLLVDLEDVASIEPSTDPDTWQLLNISDQPNINWDVWLPFNDSLNIEKGYGTHDQIDVSAAQDGSIMVDLPTKSVDFSRASASSGFNKSGFYEEYQEDEPAVSVDGLYIGESFTVVGIDSENIDGWGSTVTVSEVGTYKGQPVFSITADENGIGNVYHPAIYFDDLGVSEGDILTVSCFYRSDTGAVVTMSPYIYSPTDVASYSPSGVFSITNEFEEKVFKVTVPDTSIYTYFRFQFVRFNVPEGSEEGDEVQFTMPMITVGDKKFPFQSVGSTTEVRAPDMPSLPLENNMPEAGTSFTIRFDADIPVYKSVALSLGSEAFVIWRFSDLLAPAFRISDGETIVSASLASSVSESEGVHRYTVRYDEADKRVSCFIDGRKKGVSDLNTIDWSSTPVANMANEIRIGWGAQSTYLNSSIKNLGIEFRAQTDSEIAAQGGAK